MPDFNPFLRVALTTAAAMAAVACAGPAAAYNVFPLGPGEALKWGSNSVGTTGGVVTWSLMPDGTELDPSTAGLGMSGNSDLSSVFAQVGGSAPALASIQQAFNAWSAVADIQFVQVAESGSLPLGAPYGGAPGWAAFASAPLPSRALPAPWAMRCPASTILSCQIAVGMPVTGHPPHRSQRAQLTHWAPTLGV